MGNCWLPGERAFSSGAGNLVAVGWFTAKDDSPKVQLALSTDSGEHFSAPILVSGPNTIGRIIIAILANGQVAVSWLDT